MPIATDAGMIGVAMSKYETTYRAWADLNGQMVIFKSKPGQEPIELARKQISSLLL